jgi:hypothetical protein
MPGVHNVMKRIMPLAGTPADDSVRSEYLIEFIWVKW